MEFSTEEVRLRLPVFLGTLPYMLRDDWPSIKRDPHFVCGLNPGGGGGDSAYERGGDTRRKFWIKPLKETDLGVAQAFFDP